MCVLVLTSLVEQQQAASSGILLYPNFPRFGQNITYGDKFNRATLTPADAYQMYTVAGTGTEVVGIWTVIAGNPLFGRALTLKTGATIANNADVRTTGQTWQLESGLKPGSNVNANTSRLVFEIDFLFPAAGDFADSEMFVGLSQPTGALTQIPTTGRHIGLFFNASADNNLFFSSADGTTQETTDTGLAASTTTRVLRMEIIAGQCVFTITGGSVTATHTTNINTNAAAELHYFIETEANAAKELISRDWFARYE